MKIITRKQERRREGQLKMLRWRVEYRDLQIAKLQRKLEEKPPGKPYAVFKDCDCIKRGFEDARQAQFGRCRCCR